MARNARLEPVKLSKPKGKLKYYLSIPPALSPTGRRKQEYFETKQEADLRGRILRGVQRQRSALVKDVTAELMADAVEVESICKELGFSGLREGIDKLTAEYYNKGRSPALNELLDTYERHNSANWSDNYRKDRWKPFLRILGDLKEERISAMDSEFWRDWLADWRRREDPAPATYNQTLGMIRAVFNNEKARKIHTENRW